MTNVNCTEGLLSRRVALKVGQILVTESTGHYSYELARKAGSDAGTISKMMRKFAHRGWVSRAVVPAQKGEVGPPRTVYVLTDLGTLVMHTALRPLQLIPMST